MGKVGLPLADRLTGYPQLVPQPLLGEPQPGAVGLDALTQRHVHPSPFAGFILSDGGPKSKGRPLPSCQPAVDNTPLQKFLRKMKKGVDNRGEEC